MKIALVILTILVSTKSYAVGICDNHANLTNLWNTKYQQIVQTPDASDINNPRSYTSKIAKALCFLENAGLPKEVKFFEFFRDFVSHTFINLNSPSKAFAKVSGAGIEVFSSYFSEDPLMEYKRSSVLVHEARHLQMSARNLPNNLHVVCRNGGDLDGKRNCDDEFIPSFDRAGATSFEVLFFRKLYDESSYSLNKSHIKTWIVYLLDNSFNYVSPDLRSRYTQ